MLTLAQGGGSGHVSGVRQGHAQKHAQETRQVGIKQDFEKFGFFSSCFSIFYGTVFFSATFRALDVKFGSAVDLEPLKLSRFRFAIVFSYLYHSKVFYICFLAG
jgi:hypothetical protein